MRYAVRNWLVAGVVFASASVVYADVLTVGNGGYPDLQSAVDAAVDGDVVLLQTSFSGPTLIDGKAVSILGDTGGLPVVQRLEIRNLPAGQDLALVRLNVSGESFMGENGLAVRFCAGGVRIDDCSIIGSDAPGCDPYLYDGGLGAFVSQSSNVVFSDCTIRGGTGSSSDDDFGFECLSIGQGGQGCFVRASKVAFYDCQITGGGGGGDYDGDAYGIDGAAGLDNRDGFVFVAGGSIRGGRGGDAFDFLGGYYCYAAFGGNGGPGVRLAKSNATLVALETSLTGGAGGSACCCPGSTAGSSGQSVSSVAGSTFTDLANSARTIDVDNPAFEFTPTTITARGVPGDDVYLVLTTQTEFTYPHPIPLVQGPKLYAQPVIRRFFVGTLDASGELTTSVPVPALPPGSSNETWFWQGAFHDGTEIWGTESEPWILLDDALQGP